MHALLCCVRLGRNFALIRSTFVAVNVVVQVRVPLAEVAGVIRSLVDGTQKWEEVSAKYPAVAKKENEDA